MVYNISFPLFLYAGTSCRTVAAITLDWHQTLYDTFLLLFYYILLHRPRNERKICNRRTRVSPPKPSYHLRQSGKTPHDYMCVCVFFCGNHVQHYLIIQHRCFILNTSHNRAGVGNLCNLEADFSFRKVLGHYYVLVMKWETINISIF